jgi:peptidyl-tRNA hydrolase ICT1
MLASRVALPRLPRNLRHLSTSPRRLGPAPPELLALKELVDDEHHILARDWLDTFVPEDVPKTSYEVSYARSSGPGGQHVNKTNSKAVVRFDVFRARGVWLPPFLVPALQQSPYYHAPSLLLSSQNSRSAPKNLATCIDNLHATIAQAGRSLIRGQTSDEQRERVKELQKAEARKRRSMKEKQKSKKASRSDKGDW